MGMVAPVYYSAEMVRALPEDGQRYETVHGELLVTPSPRMVHQRILRRLIVALDRYLRDEPVGEVFSSPADISWSPDVLVQPDLFVVPMHEVATEDWSNVKNLILCVEVLSPSTARYDRFTKRRLYQEQGVPTYWIVDPNARHVELWAPRAAFPQLERTRVDWRPLGAGNHFTLDLNELFESGGGGSRKKS